MKCFMFFFTISNQSLMFWGEYKSKMNIQNNSFHLCLRDKLFSLPLQNYHYADVDFPQASWPPLTFRPPPMAWPLLLNIDASFTPRPGTTRTQHSSFRRQCHFISPVLHTFPLCNSLHVFGVRVNSNVSVSSHTMAAKTI